MIARKLAISSKAQDLILKKQRKPVAHLPIPEWPPEFPDIAPARGVYIS
jgi:hypothetical protein